MSEMSRRAEDIGFSFDEMHPGSGSGSGPGSGSGSGSGSNSGPGPSSGPGSGPGSGSSAGPGMDRSTGPGSGSTSGPTSMGGTSNLASSLAARREAGLSARPSSRIWQAAVNAGLFNGLGMSGASGSGANQNAGRSADAGTSTSGLYGVPPMGKVMTRQEMLASLEELQQQQQQQQQRSAKMEGGSGGGGDNTWMPSQGSAFGRGGASGSGGDSSSAAGPSNAWGSSTSSIDDEGSHPVMTHEGLQVYTVGHLLPRGAILDNDSWSVDVSGSGGGGLGPMFFNPEQQQHQPDSFSLSYPGQAQGQSGDSSSANDEEGEEEVVRPSHNRGTHPPEPTMVASSSARKLRVRRSTFVPGWAVPPRVLLVDDDAVTRKLSSKFLQVFGCTIDVAVDGVSAVNKMNLEKYDLVLMVRVPFF